MSTSSVTRQVGVDLGDHDEVAVGVEHVRQSDQHHFVVVDEGDDDGRAVVGVTTV